MLQYFLEFVMKNGKVVPRAVEWIDDWLAENPQWSKNPIVLAGSKELVNGLRGRLKHRSIERFTLNFESREDSGRLHTEIKRVISRRVRQHESNLGTRLRRSIEKGVATVDLAAAAKALKTGELKKLVICSESLLFGRFNSESGDVTLHNKQLNGWDDCVLDDLAQFAMDSGISTQVIHPSLLPTDSPIVGIIERKPESKVERYVEASC